MSYLAVNNVVKQFPQMDRPALDGISFTLESEEILALVGESGSGKTTISRIIAGFELGNAGSVVLGDQTLWSRKRYTPPERRKIGYVFQENTLFPHMTVEANISFGLETSGGRAKSESSHHIRRLLAMAGLEGLEHRYPHELSGGQAQRVALVRALAPKPRLLILDEPFNNLDVSLKTRVVRETAEILRESAIPAILVTHRPEEAFAVADRVAVIRDGRIVQEGSPDYLYHYPVDRTVAEFFGPINALPAHFEDGDWQTVFGPVAKEAVRDAQTGAAPEETVRRATGEPVAYVRPETFEIVQKDAESELSRVSFTEVWVHSESRQTVVGSVRRITSFGSHYEVVLTVEGLPDPLLVWTGAHVEVGTSVGVRLQSADARSDPNEKPASGQ